MGLNLSLSLSVIREDASLFESEMRDSRTADGMCTVTFIQYILLVTIATTCTCHWVHIHIIFEIVILWFCKANVLLLSLSLLL